MSAILLYDRTLLLDLGDGVRYLYTWVMRLLVPFILLRLLWRSWHAPAYRTRWGERFAWFNAPAEYTNGLWLHAVSLGESIAAVHLLKEFMTQFPHIPVTITNMTPTGSERIRNIFGDKVLNLYVPYDLPSVIKRFIKKINPKLLVIMETELWPNLLYYTHTAKIAIVLANGRLSQRSAKHYQKIYWLMQPALQCINKIAVQTDRDVKHFLQIGALPEQLTVLGNIKFDIKIAGDLRDQAEALHRQLGENRLIWLAASTHEGEEEIILSVFSRLKKEFINLLLIIVPRHPERFVKVTQQCQKQGFNTLLRSENKILSEQTDVFIGDTVGELLLFYAVCDVAFVGGSLVPAGGHNLLEAAVLSKAAVTGQYMHNFMHITKLLLTAKAITQINTDAELFSATEYYLQHADARQQAGMNAYQVVAQNRGAVARHLELLGKFF